MKQSLFNLDAVFEDAQRRVGPEKSLTAGGREIPVFVVRNLRARRYLLRIRPDGSVRLTIPRRGSIAEGWKFAERSRDWLEAQLQRQAARPKGSIPWQVGSEILFRGEPVKIEAHVTDASVRLGVETIPVSGYQVDLRPAIEKYLRHLATYELPGRVMELASEHGFVVRRISVRNQRTRWGSCSRRGTISLNWRLIQVPESVRDYIILHELMHFRQMNHSSRFWNEVRRVCPNYELAEAWLKQKSPLRHDLR